MQIEKEELIEIIQLLKDSSARFDLRILDDIKSCLETPEDPDQEYQNTQTVKNAIDHIPTSNNLQTFIKRLEKDLENYD